MKQRYFVNRLDSINPIYFQDFTKKWVQCSHCGRTLMYIQLIKHQQLFHNDNNGFIIDFIK
jgi:hypothetical protein